MGFLIILGMTVSKPAMIIGGMVVIALTAWLMTVVLSRVERIICPWKRELQL
jgi:NitT/TauT family transport system permease protein/sulfonate transport system permease protein